MLTVPGLRRRVLDSDDAFGVGRHICVGQHLARLELRVAVSRLLHRLPDVELVGAPGLSGLPAGQITNTITLEATFSPQPC